MPYYNIPVFLSSASGEAVGQSSSVTEGQGSSVGRQVYRCLQETRRHFWNSTVLSDLPLERLEVKLCHAVMDRLPCALQSLTLGGVNHKQVTSQLCAVRDVRFRPKVGQTGPN